MKRIFTFGEIMLRLSPSDKGERLIQTNSFRIEPGGSESNVAVALANLGDEVSFLTILPDNPLAEKIRRYLRQYNVDTSYIAMGGTRLGLYWTENGVGSRASLVIYDRESSAFANLTFDNFDWDKINKDALWFHTSGISPAVSENVSRTLEKILLNLDEGINISMDLNYRANLWKWIDPNNKDSLHKTMLKLCSKVFLLTGNETDFHDTLGFGENKKNNTLEIYSGIANEAFEQLPILKYVAISLRDSISASENTWSGILFVKDQNEIKHFNGPNFHIKDIVDRVGAGDSFSAGIIHGILNHGENPQSIIDFAIALSALKHTVRGDASQFTENDVIQALETGGSGRIIR
ncbi:PfkB family carbohydrate kinase [Chloroflexota bacterium]